MRGTIRLLDGWLLIPSRETEMSGKRQPPFDEPINATPVDGEVAITGPGHIHGSMTPKAAKHSAANLSHAADEAEHQTSAPQEGEDAAE